MDDSYFSEREGQDAEADRMAIGADFWGGFVSIVAQRLGNGGFAEDFPICCSDTGLAHDCDRQAVGLRLRAEVRSIDWPLDPFQNVSTLDVLDSAEFFWRHISNVTERKGHSSRSWGFQHHHFVAFDRAKGREDYRVDVNRLLRRCRHPYTLDESGKVKRRLIPTFQNLVRKGHFRTGDSELDRLLSEACDKFESPDIVVRRESLERLWDAWERLKSMCIPGDKAASVRKLLDDFVSEPQLRKIVEADADGLTKLGNALMIRHTEVDKPPITHPQHVDYVFLRLFALITSILNGKGWVTTT